MTLATPGVSRAVRFRRRARDALLLPLALLIIVLEDVLWRLARRALRVFAELPQIGLLRRWLGRLNGWTALPLFLVPELAGRVGELWVAVLVFQRHFVSAVLVYALVRVVATLIAVFIWQACAPALLRLRWFARVVGWIVAARDWALSRTAPWRNRLRRLAARSEGGLLHRARMLRLLLLARLRLPWGWP